MKYVIDNRVQIFQNGMGSLGVNEPEIFLTTAPMRLLSYLLENPNRIVSREELFKHIWEERGLTPSGTSLSQYLSILRKKFQRYGFEDSIIENVPKEGVRFNAQVTCIKETTNVEIRVGLISIKNRLFRVLKKLNENLYWLIIGAFVSVVILHFTFSNVTSFSGSQYADWIKSGYINGCEVYFPEGEMSAEVERIYTERTIAMLKKLKIKCIPKDKLLIFLQNPLNNFNHGTERQREFIAHCTLLKKSYYCYSYSFLHGDDL